MSLLDRLSHARALDRVSRPAVQPSAPANLVPPRSTAAFERRERTIELGPDPKLAQSQSLARGFGRRTDERSTLLGGCLERIALPSATGLARDLVCLGARNADRAVFLDTETTGLGGATVPFMIGIAWIERARLHCVQWILTRVSGEAELLADVLARLEAHGPAPLCSFNGASFDLPLLRVRAHRYGLSARVLDAEHLDLLHPARRLHRGRGRDCRLATLEHDLLGIRRRGDIDSAEIPEVFWSWMQSPHDVRAQRRMQAVGDHNLVDLASLPALAAWLAATVREPGDLDRALRAARHLDRLGAVDQARLLLSRWIEHQVRAARGGVRWREAALQLAELERRAGDRARAAELWEAAWSSDPGCPDASEAWAKHLEHRLGDFAAALRVARGSRDPCERRIARLEARLARREAGRASVMQPESGPGINDIQASEPVPVELRPERRESGHSVDDIQASEPVAVEILPERRESDRANEPALAVEILPERRESDRASEAVPAVAEFLPERRELPRRVAKTRDDPPLGPPLPAIPRTELLARIDETEAGAVVRYRLLR